MPAGTRGRSVKRQYTTDSGKKIVIKVPEYIAAAGGHGLAETDGTEVARPDRFSPRVLFWEAELDIPGDATRKQKIRRQIPFNANAPLSQGDARKDVLLDTIGGQTTGRRGERVSFD